MYGAVKLSKGRDGDVPATKEMIAAVSHWHLIPTCFGFTLFYTFVSIRLCLCEMLAVPHDAKYLRAGVVINLVLVTLFLWSYCAAACTNPGKMRALIEPRSSADQTSRWFCKKCNVMKPLRCHHCRRCNRCVFKMDHHCFWINNCVGLHNMKFFMLTLLYGTLGCAYMFVVFIIRWWYYLSSDVPMGFVEAVVLSLATVCIVAHGFTVAYLFGFHAYLVSKDRTSVEHRCCKGLKPGCNHDKGFLKNVEEIFGPRTGAAFYLFPTTPVVCLESERFAVSELRNLYSDHKHALPYFEDRYGDVSTPLES